MSTEESNQNKPILFLINPHSGKGKSVTIFENEILPFLESNSIKYQVFVTEENLRVNEYLRDKLTLAELISKFRSIVVVSGDGLLHETINALINCLSTENRPFDTLKNQLPPLGIIPTGSGNGLAYTLLRQNCLGGELPMNFDEALKTFSKQAIQDKTILSDLVKITKENDFTKPIYSFLSIGWGLLADIDIDSEWLRHLGELRFTLYGLLRSVTSSSYQGKLSYKKINYDNPTDCDVKSTSEKSTPTVTNNNQMIDDNDEWIAIEDRFACLYAVHQTYVSSVTKFSPKSTLTDQTIYLTFIRGKLNPCRAIEFMLAIKDGTHDKLSYVTVVPVTKFKFQPLEQSKVVVDGEVIPWSPEDGYLTAEIMPKSLRLLWDPKM